MRAPTIFFKGTKKNGDPVWINVAEITMMTYHNDRKKNTRYTIIATVHGVSQQAIFVSETPEVLIAAAIVIRD